MRSGFGALFVVGLFVAETAAEEPILFETSGGRSVVIPPLEILSADLDSDGFPDVVTLSFGGLISQHSVTSLTGGSDGVFGPPNVITLPGADEVRGIALADVDGDETPDLLMAKRGLSVVSVYLGAGDGTFSFASDVPTAPHVWDVVARDLDGDGAADFAIACAGAANPSDAPGRVQVFRGDGAGGFALDSELFPGAEPFVVAAERVDGDGFVDLVVLKIRGGTIGRTYLADGAGGWIDAGAFVSAASRADAHAFGDFDADGRLDLALHQLNDSAIRLLRGDGSGGFEDVAALTVSTGTGPEIATADSDGDGRDEIAVLGSGPPRLLCFELTAPSTFTPVTEQLLLASRLDLEKFAFADVDADGRRDFLFANDSDVHLALRRGDGRFEISGQAIPIESESVQSDLADFDRDGRADLLAFHRQRDSVSVSFGSVLGRLDPPLRVATVSAALHGVAGDFVADGFPDVAVASGEGLALLTVLPGDGDGGFGAAITAPFVSDPRGLATADFDLDELPDLVALGDDGGTTGLFPYENLGGGTFGALAPIAVVEPLCVDAALVDLDGAFDLLCGTPSGARVFLGDGGGAFSAGGIAFIGAKVVDLAWGDVDSDEVTDLVAATWTGLRVALGNGDGTFAAERTLWEGRTDCVALADFDEDGALDVVASGIFEKLRVLRGDGLGEFADAGKAFGGRDPIDLHAGDVDGDGHVDLTGLLSGASFAFELRNRAFDAIDVRRGNVGAAAGPAEDVLLVNGSPGAGAERRIVLAPGDAITLSMALPASRAGRSARFAVYVAAAAPTPATVEWTPFDLGRVGIPTPLVGPVAAPPLAVFNNIGKDALLGAPTAPSTPAPSVLLDLPGGFSRPARAYLQGFIVDDAAPNGRAATTNGVLVEIE